MLRRFFLLILTFVIAFSIGTFGATMVRAFLYSPDTEIDVPLGNEIPHSLSSVPERLVIPTLSLDAAVQQVGINTKGAMATPSNFTDVGWYKHGPAPGESGSAVIAGHVNNGLGLSGVFENLNKIQAGDDVYIVRADGTRVHFIVTGTKSYPYDDAPEEIIFNPAGSVRLNLITCEGKWLREDKTYDQRFVVFTKLASE